MSLPCQMMAEHVNCLLNLIENFDAVLLLCFCPAEFLNLVLHDRRMTSELGLSHSGFLHFSQDFVVIQ